MDRADAGLAISTVALVATVYGASLPSLVDTRADDDARGHFATAEVTTAAIAAGGVLALAAVTRSSTVAGAGMVATLVMAAAYANARTARP